MFYNPNGEAQLSQAEMKRVRRGFSGLLLKLRYHPEFIANNLDELLATAHAEYVRYVDKGIEIEDPVAWTIHCAWRRTQNLLKLTDYRPQQISTEKLDELVDEAAPTPAQAAEDAERVRKVRRAIAKLDADQRRLVALIYFEDMSLMAAARRLGWHESKARRCHAAALKRLFKALAVRSSDQIAVDVGLAAWLSLAAGSPALQLPAGFEAALDRAWHGTDGLWTRAQDLARRLSLSGGGEAAGAVASSGAGRAAGACATVAIACVAGASGVVGPGIGGVDLIGAHGQPSRAREAGAQAAAAPSSTQAAPTSEEASAPLEGSSRDAAAPAPQASLGSGGRAEATHAGRQSRRRAERRQVREQTDGIARAASESGTTEASPPSASSVSSSEGTSEPASGGSAGSGSSGGASASEEAQAKQQFSPFK